MDGIAEARRLVCDAERVVFLTGAGVSAESGIPTFRDTDGMWADYRAEELATPEGFERDPRRAWEWYGMRREAIQACRPNPGHEAIAEFMRRRPTTVVVTQNVDSLHHRAWGAVSSSAADTAPGGSDVRGSTGRASLSDRILELHGNILRERCSRCEHRVEGGEVDASGPNTIPHCASCGALVRPDVVWFGEVLDPDTLDRAFEAARAADVCVVAGTSAVVHPAASLPVATLESGGTVIEVNPEMTPLTELCALILRGDSGGVLPRILTP